MSQEPVKPVIGISCGDTNGVGPELIVRALSDQRILERCTPVVFASARLLNAWKNLLGENFTFASTKEYGKWNPKQVNVFNCWDEEVPVNPGQLMPEGGHYAWLSLKEAAGALKAGHIHGLVTAPINKKNIQSEDFKYSGHTPFLRDFFQAKEVVMMMVAPNMRVAVVTEHVPVKEVAQHISKESILAKLRIIYSSLQRDFGIDRPRIAVLGLNPHAGDEGLVGKEENEIIKPAVGDARRQGMLVFGPYSADAFFARGQFASFDAVLAMYHDQGLVPFKSLSAGEGINFTAGMHVVRTSPDHGTAMDIAGKGTADTSSFLDALFSCIEIIQARNTWSDNRRNPLKKVSARILANVQDEKIDE